MIAPETIRRERSEQNNNCEGNVYYDSYFEPQSCWNVKFFQLLSKSNSFLQFNCLRGLCCPCVLNGWVESLQHREQDADFMGTGHKFGMGPRGQRMCLQSCILCILCPPIFGLRTALSRKKIMEVYNISGGHAEVAKGCCCCCALSQHYCFLEDQKRLGTLRFPWENGEIWSLKDQPKSPTFKILIMGSPGVGKSAFFRRLLGQPFPLPYQSDHQVNIGVRTVQMEAHSSATAEIWDIPFSQKVDMTEVFFNTVHGVFILFEMDAYITWKEAKEIFRLLETHQPQSETHQSTSFTEKTPIFLVGSKSDTCPPQGCLFISEVDEFIQSKCSAYYSFVSVSSWKHNGVDFALQKMMALCNCD